MCARGLKGDTCSDLYLKNIEGIVYSFQINIVINSHLYILVTFTIHFIFCVILLNYGQVG